MSEYPQQASNLAEHVSSAVPTERFAEGCKTFEMYRLQYVTQHTYVATMLPLICSSQTFSSFFQKPFFFFFFFFFSFSHFLYDAKLGIDNFFTQFFSQSNISSGSKFKTK
jgi:hypothetical protein